MNTRITLSIETDDVELIERIGKAIKGGTAHDYFGPEIREEEEQAAPSPGPQGDYQPGPVGTAAAMTAPYHGHGSVDAAAAFTGTATEQETAEPATTEAESEPALDAAAPDPNSVETDSAGMPWDSRIHTSNKAQKQDGTWKRKPRISDEYYDQVCAELRNLMAVPGPQHEEQSEQTPPPAPAPEPETQEQAAPTPPPAPAPEPEPEQPAQPSGTADHSGMQFNELVRRITSEQVDKQAVAGALQNAGLNSLPQLMQRKDLIPQIANELFPEG